jgi:peptidoglycan/xylan/chitin deacetylase (PgdA/CDA1 family)
MHGATRIPVLMYHRVGIPDHSRDIYCVRPDRFLAHMHRLAEAGYRSVSIEDFDLWFRGERALSTGAFVLTFDDGFLGVYDHAIPVLRDLGWSATVFLVAGKMGGESDWEVTVDVPMPPHPLMTGAQIQELAAQGFSLQSHSLYHRDLTMLDTETLVGDLVDSRKHIADVTGGAPTFLAYPYGRHDAVVRAAAKSAGFRAAFSVDCGFNRPGGDPFRVRRIDVFGTDTSAMLLRKIRLGTNDGSLVALAKYYGRRLLQGY